MTTMDQHPDNDNPMSPTMTRWIGASNVAAGILGLATLVTTYGLAENLVTLQENAPDGVLATRTIHVLGAAFPVTLSMSLLLLGAASGLVGSAIQQSIVFANRSGHDTLERGWAWWYLLRPIWSALLGGVFVIAMNTGLISIGDTTTSTAGVTVLATIGALAGLFTDKVLEKLGDLLGATSTEETTSSSSATSTVVTA